MPHDPGFLRWVAGLKRETRASAAELEAEARRLVDEAIADGRVHPNGREFKVVEVLGGLECDPVKASAGRERLAALSRPSRRQPAGSTPVRHLSAVPTATPDAPTAPRRRPTSAIAMARPGGAGEVLSWAVETGRIDASARHDWESRMTADPEATEQQLRALPFRAWATDGYDKPAPGRLFAQRAAAAGASAGDAIFGNIPEPAGRRPEAFAAGALPRTTASGSDPKLLARINLGDEDRTAAARINCAAAQTAATFHELYERYTGPHAAAERIELDQPGASEQWADFQARVHEWAITPDLGS